MKDKTQIGNIIILICSAIGLYFIIAQLNPIFIENKINMEGMTPIPAAEVKEKSMKDQKKHTGNREVYFAGRAMERLQDEATGDMKWLKIVDEEKKSYRPKKSALPANFNDPNAENKYLNTYIHKWKGKIPDDMKLEPKVMYNRPPQIGDNEMPAAELGSSMNDFRQAAGIPVEGMTSVRPLSVYEKKVKGTGSNKKLDVVTPGANKTDTELKKKIDTCENINKASGGAACANLAGTDCGFCLDQDKAMYGDANGPIENVCQTKHWTAPGPDAVYECTKAKERRICRGMKDCGDVAGEKTICGWCPSQGKGLVKKIVGNGYDVKYPEVDYVNEAALKQAQWLGWESTTITNVAI